jgi:hypothetical protein
MTQEQIKSLKELAQEVYDECGPDRAETELEKRIARRPEYVAAAISLAVHYLARLCGHAVRKIIAGDEQDIGAVILERRDKQQAAKVSKDVQRRVDTYLGKFLSWPMSTSKRLGDSNREEVGEEAEMYERQASGNAHRGRFMRLVQRRTPTGKLVGQVLSDGALAKLYSKAKTETPDASTDHRKRVLDQRHVTRIPVNEVVPPDFGSTRV